MIRMDKKAQQAADYMAFGILIAGTVFLIIFSVFLVPNSILKNAHYKIKVEMDDFSEKTFLIPFLKTPVGEETIVDLIVRGEYNKFIAETNKILDGFYDHEVEWKYSIGSEWVKGRKKGIRYNGRPVEYEIMLPTISGHNIINFKMIIYRLK